MDSEQEYQSINQDNYEQEFITQIKSYDNAPLTEPPKNKSTKRIFLIVFIVVIVLITVASVIVSLVLLNNKKDNTIITDDIIDDNFFKAETSVVEILVAPSSATITIDEEKYTNGEYELAPGQYTVSVKKTGFKTYNSSIIIVDKHKTYFTICLNPDSGNTDYYEQHPEDLAICQSAEELADVSAWEQNALLDEIFEYTPLHNDANGYYVDPYYDDQNKLIIKISFKDCNEKEETLRNRVYTWMREQNLNPDNYTFEESWDCEN